MKNIFANTNTELANDVISEFDSISTRIDLITKILWKAELLTVIAAQHKDSSEQLLQNRHDYERAIISFYLAGSSYIEKILTLVNKSKN